MERSPDQALAELMQDFAVARQIVTAAAPMTSSPGMFCRYCANHWLRYDGGKYDGHVQCFVTREFKIALARAFREAPGLTYAKLSAALGVTVGGVRAWGKAGLKHLGEETPGVLRAWEWPVGEPKSNR